MKNIFTSSCALLSVWLLFGRQNELTPEIDISIEPVVYLQAILSNAITINPDDNGIITL